MSGTGIVLGLPGAVDDNDEIVREPVVRNLRFLLPITSSAKVRTDCMFSSGVGMQPPKTQHRHPDAGTKLGDVTCVKSVGRDQVQHLIEGETASPVKCRRVRGVAEPRPKPSRGLGLPHSVGHPDSDSNRAADSLARA